MGGPIDPEWLWNRLLSEEPALIQIAWEALGPDQRADVLSHLQAMAGESGWQPGQRRAARAALSVLDSDTDRKTAERPPAGKRKSGR